MSTTRSVIVRPSPELIGRTTYAYDSTYQVTVAKGSTTTTYAYDAVGNRSQLLIGAITDIYSYDAANQFLVWKDTGGSGGTSTYTYDGGGNRIRLANTVGGYVTTYVWDAENRCCG